tara:strand:+ start:3217 stop:3873 length:657 start_codon:yes stop_codon:yes gene_type:complete
VKLGIITYDVPHLKTQQLIQGLLDKNYELSLYITKFKKYKNREVLINHRPHQFVGKSSIELANYYKLNLYEIDDIEKKENINYYLIGGSALIDNKYIVKDKIINSHPGLVPSVRGLDAFKWSILKNINVGNTLHFINENVDDGRIISLLETPVKKNDTIETLSKRHYECEISILINFEDHMNNPNYLKLPEYEPNKRMNIELEKKVLNFFPEYMRNRI